VQRLARYEKNQYGLELAIQRGSLPCWNHQAVLYFSFVETAVVSIISSLVPTAPTCFEKASYVRKTADEVRKDFKASIGRATEGTTPAAGRTIDRKVYCCGALTE
jgi:hypothetical protein